MPTKRSAKPKARAVGKPPALAAPYGVKDAATIEGSERPLRLEYLPAEQLSDNPANWRLHPPEQLDAIDSLMTDVGWAGALLYNETTKHLLDGHGRKANAIKRGGLVPVLIGRWSPAQEKKILAFYDSVGDMAEVSSAKLEELLQDIGDVSDALRPAVEEKLINWTRATVPVTSLKDHPRNYKQHPPEQVEHIARSITESGFFRAIVVARDNTILAGHGVKQGAMRAGKAWVPVIRMPLDPNDEQALKILAADNEIGQLAIRDDRALTDMLHEMLTGGSDLIGTGYDKRSFAAYAFTTRGELSDFDAAAEWVGMPEYETADRLKVMRIHCRTDADMEQFIEKLKEAFPGITVNKRLRLWNAWWPPSDRKDVAALRWEAGEDDATVTE